MHAICLDNFPVYWHQEGAALGHGRANQCNQRRYQEDVHPRPHAKVQPGTIVTVLNIARTEATKLVKTARPLSNLVNEASITRPARAISAPSMSEHSLLNKRYTSPP